MRAPRNHQNKILSKPDAKVTAKDDIFARYFQSYSNIHTGSQTIDSTETTEDIIDNIEATAIINNSLSKDIYCATILGDAIPLVELFNNGLLSSDKSATYIQIQMESISGVFQPYNNRKQFHPYVMVSLPGCSTRYKSNIGALVPSPRNSKAGVSVYENMDSTSDTLLTYSSLRDLLHIKVCSHSY